MIKTVSFEKELKSNYINYAMSVIISRAIPDVRDGLKPVQRRILYTMYELGLRHDKQYKKSATVVGNCIAKYHPHGDQPVYEALVRMAQDFNMRYPLIDGHGNFGSIDGDSPAAMRYTECRLSKIAEEMLEYLNKDTVDFIPNFDGTSKEPIVLPSKIPNLLINGSLGIAVGFSTNIPPHNIVEVCDALIYLLENPNARLEDIIKIIKGPDFPTGGIILDKKRILNIYKSGKGTIRIRARAVVEGNKIIITEIPYQVNKSKIVQEIAELIKNKEIDGIISVRDESDREGIRIVIHLKKGVDVNNVLKSLYEKTSLETSFNVINLVLVDGQPRILNLKEMLLHYLNFRLLIERRRVEYELKREIERKEKLESIIFLIENLDDVLEIIRRAKSEEEILKEMVNRYGIEESKVRTILNIRLHNLSRYEYEKVKQEYEECLKTIKELEEILKNENKLKEIVKRDIERIKFEYGDKRRTEIIEESEEVVHHIYVDFARNIIKRTHENIGIEVREKEKLIVILDDGRVYFLKPDRIPYKETPIDNILKLKGSKIMLFDILPKRNKQVIIVTEDSYIKRVDLSGIEKSGRKIVKNSKIIFASLCKGKKKLKIIKDKKIFEIPIKDLKLCNFDEKGQKLNINVSGAKIHLV